MPCTLDAHALQPWLACMLRHALGLSRGASLEMCCEDAAVLQVVRRLEAATHTEVAKLGTNNLLRTLNAFNQAIFLCDVASRGWPVLHANAAMLERLGTVSVQLQSDC